MKKFFMTIAAVAGITAITACQSNKENSSATTTPQETPIERTIDNSAMAMPRIIVYKTKADYSNLVPINMDDSKSTVVSYPDPRDIKDNKRPTALDNGYLLDNFGIGKNVVYTDYTYEAYTALESAPDVDTLMQHIMDKSPLTEYYVSNENYPRGSEGRTAETLNQAIANGMEGFNKIEL